MNVQILKQIGYWPEMRDAISATLAPRWDFSAACVFHGKLDLIINLLIAAALKTFCKVARSRLGQSYLASSVTAVGNSLYVHTVSSYPLHHLGSNGRGYFVRDQSILLLYAVRVNEYDMLILCKSQMVVID